MKGHVFSEERNAKIGAAKLGVIKLDDETVRQILASSGTQMEIARQFGVSQGLVNAIKNFRGPYARFR